MFLTESLTVKKLLSKRFQYAHYSMFLGTILFFIGYLIWRISYPYDIFDGSETVKWYVAIYQEITVMVFWFITSFPRWFALIELSSIVIALLYVKENRFSKWWEIFLSNVPLFILMVSVVTLMYISVFLFLVLVSKLIL